MWDLRNCLKADFYKFYHSNIIKLHLIIPIMGIITFLSYYLISPWSEVEKVMVYMQIVSMVFPLIISVIVNMVYEQEQEAGFQYFLGIVNKRSIAHFSKLISIFVFGLISTIITILGFGITFYLMGNNSVGIELYFRQSLVIFGSNIIIYMVQYLVVFSFGKGASIGLGIVGSLVSALMLTSIGDRIWYSVPWSYSIRLSSYTTLEALNIMVQNQPIAKSITMMLTYIVISLVLLLIFSNHWEGRKENY